MRRPPDLTTGTVSRWHDHEGWGVLVSPEVPGGVFAHISSIRDQPGERSLREGQTAYFNWEQYPPLQDGCPNRALDVYRTPNGEPVPPREQPPGAYRSWLAIEYDDKPDPPQG